MVAVCAMVSVLCPLPIVKNQTFGGSWLKNRSNFKFPGALDFFKPSAGQKAQERFFFGFTQKYFWKTKKLNKTRISRESDFSKCTLRDKRTKSCHKISGQYWTNWIIVKCRRWSFSKVEIEVVFWGVGGGGGGDGRRGEVLLEPRESFQKLKMKFHSLSDLSKLGLDFSSSWIK